MSIFRFDDAEILVGGQNISGQSNSVSLEWTVEMLDRTTFGDSSRRRHPGLRSAAITVAGFYDASTGGSGRSTGEPDLSLFDSIGSTSSIFEVISVAPESGGAVGGVGFAFKAKANQYNPGETVGNLLSFDFAAQGDDELVRGTIMENAAITSSGFSALLQMTTSTGGAVASNQRLHGAFHVTSITQIPANNATLTVTVESDNSSGFLSAITRLNFTVVGTEVTAEFKSTAGPITDDWFRARYAISDTNTSTGLGNFTVYLTLGVTA